MINHDILLSKLEHYEILNGLLWLINERNKLAVEDKSQVHCTVIPHL
mgnify:CR=1 FL=1